MRVILSGPVTKAHLNDAALLAGIVPTSFLSNGMREPPSGTGLPTVVMQPDRKLGEAAERARDYTLVQHAEALVCVGHNEHLTDLAELYGLAVYRED